MLSIDHDNRSQITRGDSAYITVNLTGLDGNPYDMVSGDMLALTVRKKAEDTSPVLLQATSDTNTIALKPAQTAQMEPGGYSYDIQLTTAAGDVFTVVGAIRQNVYFGNFIVLPEVTM